MRFLFSKSKALALGLAATSMVLAGCTAANDSGIATSSERASSAEVAMVSEITVFRSPTCGCCGKWIEHAQAAGFQVEDEITEDMAAIYT